MSDQSGELERTTDQSIEVSAADAAIEPFKAGGVIESAIGGYEPNMDGIVGSHLANIAMLEARGDKSPERPVYIFNPDTGLLINYSLRRNEDPAKSGLFADVVELDESGKPRHGVSVVNPFAGTQGFINVAVGDNRHGFAPSYTDLKLDSDDPLLTVPPNLETADLLAMLGADEITVNESVLDFVGRRQAQREEFRDKVRAQQGRQYLGTLQTFTELTNPDMHLIISDRDDISPLSAASREAGLYPLVVSGDEVLEHYIKAKQMPDAPRNLGESIPELLRSTYPELYDWLGKNAVSFLTVDIPSDNRWDEQSGREVTISLPMSKWSRKEDGSVEWADMPRSYHLYEFTREIMQRSPVFARLINPMLHPEYSSDGKVEKEAHGDYMQVPVSVNPENIQEYTDWLRKVRLDMALTLYLRGLNQIG